MGIMTGAGSLSRVLGPVFVGSIYTRLGTNWTFGVTSVMMALSMVWLIAYNNQLLPPSVAEVDKNANAGAGTEMKAIKVTRSRMEEGDAEDEDQHKEKLLKSDLEAKYVNNTS